MTHIHPQHSDIPPNRYQRILEENIKLHQKESSVYDSSHAEIFNPNEQKRLAWVLGEKVLSGMRNAGIVIDIGAGTGNIASKVVGFGCRVVACDLSFEMIQRLQEKLSPETSSLCVGLVVCNAELLPFKDGIANVVTAYSVLHHLPDTSRFIGEAGRILARGGIAFFDHDGLRKQTGLGWLVYRFMKKIYSLTQWVQWKINGPWLDDAALAFKRSPFPHAERLLGDIDFTLTDGNYVGLDVVNDASREWRSGVDVEYYFAEYGYFSNILFHFFGYFCRVSRIGFCYLLVSK
jgi:ubiquinone/menaquinone biosynthesis C-methylase UbiE